MRVHLEQEPRGNVSGAGGHASDNWDTTSSNPGQEICKSQKNYFGKVETKYIFLFLPKNIAVKNSLLCCYVLMSTFTLLTQNVKK
jgi:hypothetical protein